MQTKLNLTLQQKGVLSNGLSLTENHALFSDVSELISLIH